MNLWKCNEKKKMRLFIPFRKFLYSPWLSSAIFLAGCGHGNVKTSLSKRIMIITFDLYRCHHKVRQLENPAIKMNRLLKLRTCHTFVNTLVFNIHLLTLWFFILTLSVTGDIFFRLLRYSQWQDRFVWEPMQAVDTDQYFLKIHYKDLIHLISWANTICAKEGTKKVKDIVLGFKECMVHLGCVGVALWAFNWALKNR